MDKENQSRLLRKAFSDIARGYSVAFYEEQRLYIKHLSHHEQVDLDVLYKSFVESGTKEGLPTTEYMMSYLKLEGIWTEADEKELEDITTVIERLVAGKKVISLHADLQRQNKDIEEHRERYYKKKVQKDKLIGLTAETYAEKKVNVHYIAESFYTDAACKNKFLTDALYEDFSEQEMQNIIKVYNDEIETVSDQNIKRLSIQEFFQVYWSLSTENLFHFFGKPICDLTYFQVKLGSYGRMFKNILEKAEGFPEDVRNDPDKLLDYVRIGENAKEQMEKAAANSPDNESVASTTFGAKTEDYHNMGMQTDGTTSLTGELQKKLAEGKKGLDMADLMKMMGV